MTDVTEVYNSLTLQGMGVCSSSSTSTSCQFNPGAHFCIRSPLMQCELTHYESSAYKSMSTQCCYSTEGSLITEGDSPGATGSINVAFKSIDNAMIHYVEDLLPKLQCCLTKDNCSSFLSRRPPTLGDYRGAPTASAEFGGHFASLDGNRFLFLGVGVYELINVTTAGDFSANLGDELRIQIVTRSLGGSVVIVGFVLQQDDFKFELLRDELYDTSFLVDEEEHDPILSRFVKSGFEVQFNLIAGSVTGVSLRNLKTGFVLRASQIGIWMNLYVQLPNSKVINGVSLVGGLIGFLDEELIDLIHEQDIYSE